MNEWIPAGLFVQLLISILAYVSGRFHHATNRWRSGVPSESARRVAGDHDVLLICRISGLFDPQRSPHALGCANSIHRRGAGDIWVWFDRHLLPDDANPS
jgi:hypothetical protein